MGRVCVVGGDVDISESLMYMGHTVHTPFNIDTCNVLIAIRGDTDYGNSVVDAAVLTALDSRKRVIVILANGESKDAAGHHVLQTVVDTIDDALDTTNWLSALHASTRWYPPHETTL
jgi:hypothetical protein